MACLESQSYNLQDVRSHRRRSWLTQSPPHYLALYPQPGDKLADIINYLPTGIMRCVGAKTCQYCSTNNTHQRKCAVCESGVTL